MFGVTLGIIDARGDEVPWDGATPGELVAKGPWVCRGYYREDGDAIDAAGWLHTGDIATIDPDGYIHITAPAAPRPHRPGPPHRPRSLPAAWQRHHSSTQVCIASACWELHRHAAAAATPGLSAVIGSPANTCEPAMPQP